MDIHLRFYKGEKDTLILDGFAYSFAQDLKNYSGWKKAYKCATGLQCRARIWTTGDWEVDAQSGIFQHGFVITAQHNHNPEKAMIINGEEEEMDGQDEKPTPSIISLENSREEDEADLAKHAKHLAVKRRTKKRKLNTESSESGTDFDDEEVAASFDSDDSDYGSILAANEALKQHESKAEMDAAQARIKSLEETNRELERKVQNSEAQLQQTFERNRELEHELNNTQAKTRDLEAKFAQTDVGQLIKFMEEKSESLKNCEVSRLQYSLETKDNEIARLKQSLEANNNEIANLQDSLSTKNIKITHLKLSLEDKNNELQTERKLRLSIAERLEKKDEEAANLSDDFAIVKEELCDSQKRLEAAENQNIDAINEKEKMEEQLAEWQRYHQLISQTAKFGDRIGKEKQEPTNAQSLQQQDAHLLSPAAGTRQSQESESNGDSADDDSEDDAKKTPKVASRSFENIL